VPAGRRDSNLHARVVGVAIRRCAARLHLLIEVYFNEWQYDKARLARDRITVTHLVLDQIAR